MFEESRLCRDCGRWLHYYNGKYWCHSCLEIFDIQDTLENKNSCRFIEAKELVGSVFTCLDCNKTLIFDVKQLYEMEEERRLEFEKLPIWVQQREAYKSKRALEVELQGKLEEAYNRLVSGITS